MGTRPTQKAPLTPEKLRSMVQALPDSPIGLPDRALLLVGFVGALRRGELMSITVEDLEFVAAGVTVMVARSKTDQAGAGAKIGISCSRHERTWPVPALRAWLAASGIATDAACDQWIVTSGSAPRSRLNETRGKRSRGSSLYSTQSA